jgi:dTDP-4-dehydrorhamnose 3,5-epimerase
MDSKMKSNQIHDLTITQGKIVLTDGGMIRGILTANDPCYCGFGEAYLSSIDGGVTRGWKRHRRMTLNLTVVQGCVRFCIFDEREGSESFGVMQYVELTSVENKRLTIPPMLWFAFSGTGSSTNMLLNIADIKHSEAEIDRAPLNYLKYAF